VGWFSRQFLDEVVFFDTHSPYNQHIFPQNAAKFCIIEERSKNHAQKITKLTNARLLNYALKHRRRIRLHDLTRVPSKAINYSKSMFKYGNISLKRVVILLYREEFLIIYSRYRKELGSF
jgi:hypothetical protein